MVRNTCSLQIEAYITAKKKTRIDFSNSYFFCFSQLLLTTSLATASTLTAESPSALKRYVNSILARIVIVTSDVELELQQPCMLPLSTATLNVCDVCDVLRLESSACCTR
jgi:hypothetical protein